MEELVHTRYGIQFAIDDPVGTGTISFADVTTFSMHTIVLQYTIRFACPLELSTWNRIRSFGFKFDSQLVFSDKL